MRKILVVEDEFSINDILTYSLEEEGYMVKGVYNGKDAKREIVDFSPDLVLLDVMLPDIDGFKLCEEFTEKAYVIMVTARGEVIDRIKGIEIGADDYISKPFDINEIIARVNAIFRREESRENKGEDLIIDEKNRKISYKGRVIELKKKEFDLLLFLKINRNIVCSRDLLLDRVWGLDYEGEERTVDVHIRRIREKLGEVKGDSIIKTIFRVGYVMR